VNQLGRAQATLREARDAEVEARHAWDRARRRALLSEKSPMVTRGGYTVAEQQAWVDEQCADLKSAMDKAVVVREAAQDHLRLTLAQAEIVRSLGASVRAAYSMAGVDG
jgi:predicted nucleotidyltransferase